MLPLPLALCHNPRGRDGEGSYDLNQSLPSTIRMGKFTGIRATSTASETDGKFRKEPVTEQVGEMVN